MSQSITAPGRALRQVVATAVIILGLGLALTPLVLSLFGRVSSAEAMVDGVRPAMTAQALRATQQDLDTLRTAVDQLQSSAAPRTASRLGQSPRQFAASVDAAYPDVAAGLAQFPKSAADAQALITALTNNRTRFESAGSIPMPGLPPRASPWIFVSAGVVLIIAGFAALRLARLGFGVALLVGALLAIVPLATSLPAKTNDAADLVVALHSALSRDGAAQARVEAASADRMIRQLQTAVLPSLGQRLQMTPDQFDSFLADGSPLLAHGMPQVNASLASLVAQAAALNGEVDNYSDTAAIPLRALPWLFVVPGIVVLVVSGLALWATGRSRTIMGSPSPWRRTPKAAPQPTLASPPTVKR